MDFGTEQAAVEYSCGVGGFEPDRTIIVFEGSVDIVVHVTQIGAVNIKSGGFRTQFHGFVHVCEGAFEVFA